MTRTVSEPSRRPLFGPGLGRGWRHDRQTWIEHKAIFSWVQLRTWKVRQRPRDGVVGRSLARRSCRSTWCSGCKRLEPARDPPPASCHACRSASTGARTPNIAPLHEASPVALSPLPACGGNAHGADALPRSRPRAPVALVCMRVLPGDCRGRREAGRPQAVRVQPDRRPVAARRCGARVLTQDRQRAACGGVSVPRDAVFCVARMHSLDASSNQAIFDCVCVVCMW